MKIKILVLWVFWGGISLAQNKTVIQETTAIPVIVSATNQLVDPNFNSTINNDYDLYDPVFWIEFKYDQKSNIFFGNSNFNAEVNVLVEYWHHDNTTGQTTINLNVQYDGNQISAKNKYLAYKMIKSNKKIQKAKYTIISVTGIPATISPIFQLKLKMFTNYVFKPSFSSFSNIGNTYSIGKSNLDFYWTRNPTGIITPDEYDFEWQFIDSMSKEFILYKDYLLNTSTKSFIDFPFNQFQFSRLTTKQSTITNIPLLYTGGFIVYRFREVYYGMNNERITGQWIQSKTISGGYPQILAQQISGHEPNLNWNANVNFAEEAKHHETINYYDGSLRGRQSVAFNNSVQKAFIQETIYDKEGRKIASILPFPFLGTNSFIKYYQEANVDSINLKPLSSENIVGELCSSSPSVLSRTKGAGNYYSDVNPIKNLGFHSFIPDAKGYPFTTIEYKKDNTQRIRRSGGLGREFRLGSGRETKNFYVKAYREEIDRLFGTDVGYNNFYFKTAVLDPNGQLSISYLDKENRVIATSLAGESANSAIIKNDNNLGNYPISYNLIDPEEFIVDSFSRKTYGNTTLFVSGSQTMNFYLSADSADYIASCKTTHCSDCYYDVNVSIKSDCIPYATDKYILYRNYTSLDTIDTLCNKKLRPINDSFSHLLPTGDYEISATLTVPKKVIDFYTEKFLRDTGCLPSLDDLIKKHKANMTPCFKTCEECLTYYGNVDSTVARMYRKLKANGQSFSNTQDSINIIRELYVTANKSKQGCDFYCKKSNSCETLHQLLLADVSPGGQYAMQWDTSRNKWMISDLSIYTSTNFNSENIKRNNGNSFIFTQYAELEEIVTLFHDTIAEKLIKYHPEYCYYQYCMTNSAHHDFMDSLDEIETWSKATSLGLIPPPTLGSNWKNIVSYLVNRDPYIINKSVFTTQLNQYFLTKTMNSALNDTFSLFDLALLYANKNFIKSNSANKIYIDYSYLDTSSCIGLKDMIWNQFKFLYKNAVGMKYAQDIKISCKYPDTLKIGLCRDELIRTKFFTPVNPGFFPYCVKAPRYYNLYDIDTTYRGVLSGMIKNQTPAQMQQAAYEKMRQECDSNCVRQADGWILAIGDCQLNGEKEDLKLDLIAICQNSCNEKGNGFGNSSTKDGEIILLPQAKVYASSFQEVIDLYKKDANDTTDCNANNIDLMFPYNKGHKAYTTQNILLMKDSCICNNLAAIVSNITYTSMADLHSKLIAKYGLIDYNTSVEELTYLLKLCNSQDTLCVYAEKPISIPNIFACQNRINCKMYKLKLKQFYKSFPNFNNDFKKVSSSFKNKKLFLSFMNKGLKMNLSFLDYKSLLKSCDSCNPDTGYSSSCTWIIDKYEEFIELKELLGVNYESFKDVERIVSFKLYISDMYGYSGSYDDLYNELRTCIPDKFPQCNDLNRYLDSFYKIYRVGSVFSSRNELPVARVGQLTSYLNAVIFQHKYSFTQHEYINMLKACGDTVDISFDCSDLYHYYLTFRQRFPRVSSYLAHDGYKYLDTNIYGFNMFQKFIFEHSNYKVDTATLRYLLRTCYTCSLVDLYNNSNSDSFQSETNKINLTKGTNHAYADVYRFYYRFCSDSNNVGDEQGTMRQCCMFFNAYSDSTSFNTGKQFMFQNGDTITTIQYQNLVFAFLWDYNLLYQKYAGLRQRTFCALDYNYMKEIIEDCLGLNFVIVPPNPIHTIIPSWEVSGDKCDKVIYDRYTAPKINPKNNCERQMEKLALTAALEEYERMRSQLIKEFQTKYVNKCLRSSNIKFHAKGISNEFQFTLYYYGQDGNLLKTVPPLGVNPFTTKADLDLVLAKRKLKQIKVPSHTLVTTYKYNTLNAVTEQNTPDAGTSRFVYDELGRLLISQNSEQARLKNNMKRYSYTIYDYLSRVTESGEIECNPTIFDGYFTLNYKNYPSYFTDLNSLKPNSNLRNVTRTYYDKNKFVSVNAQFENGIQENPRKRIVSITLDTLDADKNENSYQSALHYSYDIVGNVKSMVSENNLLSSTLANQKYKRIDYDYDLVSGKVNKVKYQNKKPDQFLYKYEYDAENRLIEAKSSIDDIYWQKDASYQYYLHGPLARTVLGDNEVQGVDYAYTIQGWLKAINASTLNDTFDMGQDGKLGGLNVNTARDAVALSLRYFSNDYNQIGRMNLPVEAIMPNAIDSFGLYNGNIISQTVSLKNPSQFSPTMSYRYRYDQLNRLVRMESYKPISLAQNNINAINSNFTGYNESVSYDPNGNILSYQRNNDVGNLMDNLTYNYHATKKNQLIQVQDAIGASINDMDIDNQLKSNNYVYDSIGNLIADSSENMKISWTPAGKIAQIIQGNKNLIINFGYDPMGNRISKTVTYTNNAYSPKTTYYTRDAQGNTMAVYDNHFGSMSEIPCVYDQNDINSLLNNFHNDIINTVINPFINMDYPDLENGMNNYINSMLPRGETSCEYQAKSYILSLIGPFPDPVTYHLSGFWIVNQIKMEVEANYMGMTKQDIIDNLKNNVLPGEDPIAVEAWATYFWNIYNYNNPSNTIFSDLNAQGYKYSHQVVKNVNDSLYWREQHLYGSSRLGMHTPDKEVVKTSYHLDSLQTIYTGMRQYELTNHLGNVLSTIKDEKKQIQLGTSGFVSYYEPIVQNATDYYPFGMPMPNRTYSLSSKGYRFGFNTQEKDDEVYGEGNLNTAQFWEYDTRIGRRWNVDPKLKIWESPYATFSNNPVLFIDINGDSSITLANGKTGEIGNNVSYNEDKSIMYNNSNAKDKNWQYATYNSETKVYDFHMYPSPNFTPQKEDGVTEALNSIDKYAGYIESTVDLTATLALEYAMAQYKSAQTWSEWDKLRDAQKNFRIKGELGKYAPKVINGLGTIGKAMGWVQVGTSAGELINQYVTTGEVKTSTMLKFGSNVGQAFLKTANPYWGIGLGLLDASGALDAVYENIGNSIDGTIKKE